MTQAPAVEKLEEVLASRSLQIAQKYPQTWGYLEGLGIDITCHFYMYIYIYIYIHTYLHDMKQNSIGLSQHVGVFLGKPVRTKYVGYFFHCYVWLRKGSHWLKPHPPFKHPHSFLSQSYAQNHPLPFVAYVLYRKRRVMMVSIFFSGISSFSIYRTCLINISLWCSVFDH